MGLFNASMTAALAINLYFAAVSGGASSVMSILFVFAGSYIGGIGIGLFTLGAFYGYSILKYRVPLESN